MIFEARVLLYSVDGEEWTVDRREYVTINDYLDKGVLKEGDVIRKRLGRWRDEKCTQKICTC